MKCVATQLHSPTQKHTPREEAAELQRKQSGGLPEWILQFWSGFWELVWLRTDMCLPAKLPW